MEQNVKFIAYAYEYGDETLPHIADLVTACEDPEKENILAYLDTNCVAGCPGVVRDLINPTEVIGAGHLYSDGVYLWDDVFANYVRKYNIPVPPEFRDHIMQNYQERMKKHEKLSLVDCVEIYSNPYLGYAYNIKIHKNGVIEYSNNFDCKDGAILYIQPTDAAYIIEPIMTKVFCYDSVIEKSENYEECIIIDGYHWKMTFYHNKTIVGEFEGKTGENPLRYAQLKRILLFAERYIPKDLGTQYMTYIDDEMMSSCDFF